MSASLSGIRLDPYAHDICFWSPAYIEGEAYTVVDKESHARVKDNKFSRQGGKMMEKPSFDFLPYSTERRSNRREPNPDPVPPPKEWKMRNP